MTKSAGYPVYDADNHMYETRDALLKYLPKEYAGAVRYVEIDGRTKIMFKNHLSDMIPNPTFARVARPGSAEEWFHGRNPEGKSFREFIGEAMDVLPAFQEPGARLELMDEQGLTAAVMYPTLASLVEERTADDVHLTHAILHALNQWMYEHWTFDYQGRIFATPVISLAIVEKAIEELHWCLERGMKTFLVRPAPVPSITGKTRSPGLPEFDPFWQAVVDAGVPVTFHGSDSGYAKHLAEWEGGDEQGSFGRHGALHQIVIGHRAIEDTMSALICHGALSRFPELKVLSVENGSSWVRGLLDQLDKAYGMMPQEFAEPPVEVFRRNIWVHPFLEDDFGEILGLVGEDHVLFGSDFPHPEGVANPLAFADRLAGLPATTVEKFMGANYAGVLGVEARA
ncbi:amidohydrolase family protein [Mycolicibacterium vinylchloridicum]|uniref:amidohydrolase family protein n=1 Tax=Mycolicibacterium vinylchloridicum TaxID=2736928 RepID=UPI0015CACAAC|nr:amidohydrolase family protein [Mycolicibacterium vinylchloridicum]